MNFIWRGNNIKNMGREEHMEALNAELEKLTKGNVDLMNKIKDLRGRVEKMSKKGDRTVCEYESEESDEGWFLNFNGDKDKERLDAEMREHFPESQTEDGQSGNDGGAAQGQEENSPGEDDEYDEYDEGDDDEYQTGESGADAPEDSEPEGSEWDDGASEHLAENESYEEDMEDADDWYPSTFLRRLNMLSPHQVTLPKLEEIEDFDAWEKALRELSKFVGVLGTLEGYPSWRKTDEENDEEHDWLEFMISQSLSSQFKKMLDTQDPEASASEMYALLKENLADKRRSRRDQLVAQLDRLSHATSGDNASEYLEQFLMIREKLMGLGDEGKVSESAIFGRFYTGLRTPGSVYTWVVGYQMYQATKGEQSTVESFAAYASHLLRGRGVQCDY